MTLEEMLRGLFETQPSQGGGVGEIVRSKLADPTGMPAPDSGRVAYAGFGSMVPGAPNTQSGHSRLPVRISGGGITNLSAGLPGSQSGPAIARPPGLDASKDVPSLAIPGIAYAPPVGQKDDAYKAPQRTESAPVFSPPDQSGFGAFLRGLGKGGGALLPAIGEGMGAVEAQGRNRLAQNQTYQWLLGKGSPAEEAQAAIGNPELLKNLITKYSNPALTDDQREYAAAQRQGYKGSLMDFIKESRRTNALRWVNTGTVMEGRDPVTGAVVATTPIDVEGKKAAEERGEAQGKAQTNLPMAELAADKMTKLLDAIIDSPKLPSMTGYSAWLPNATTEAQELQSRIDQVQGRTFLQAFNDLRGGGAITENEGRKATEAYNRLANMKVTEAGYQEALKEFKQDVADLLVIARKKAGGGSAPASTGTTSTAPPTSGTWSIQRVD